MNGNADHDEECISDIGIEEGTKVWIFGKRQPSIENEATRAIKGSLRLVRTL